MKRFYTHVEIQSVGAQYALLLYGREIRSPNKLPLRVPSLALAEVVAQEWRSQGTKVDLVCMPYTRYCYGAADFSDVHAQDVKNKLLQYADTDLLFYGAEYPTSLQNRQKELWEPFLQFVEQRANCSLLRCVGAQYRAQPESYLLFIKSFLQTLSAFELFAFKEVCYISGSVVLPFCVFSGSFDVTTAWASACVDDFFALETWGEDEEARRALTLKQQDFERACFVLLNVGK